MMVLVFLKNLTPLVMYVYIRPVAFKLLLHFFFFMFSSHTASWDNIGLAKKFTFGFFRNIVWKKPK